MKKLLWIAVGLLVTLAAGFLVGPSCLVGLGATSPGAAVVRAIDESGACPAWYKAGLPICMETFSADEAALSVRGEGCIRMTVMNRQFAVPRNAKTVVWERDQLSDELGCTGLMIATPEFTLSVHFLDKAGKPPIPFGLAIDDKQTLRVVVKGLRDAGIANEEAKRVVAKEQERLLELSDEALFLRVITVDRAALGKERDVARCAEGGLLLSAAAMSWQPWQRAAKIAAAERTIYAGYSAQSNERTAVLFLHEVDSSGRVVLTGGITIPDAKDAIKDAAGYIAQVLLPTTEGVTTKPTTQPTSRRDLLGQ